MYSYLTNLLRENLHTVNGNIAGIGFLFMLVASIFVPIDLPYTVESTAKVFPVQQWVLHKSLDGTLVSTLHDYRSGLMQDYKSYQFDRGDVINIQFNPQQHASQSIMEGELIASINSNMMEERLIELHNELALTKANLGRQKVGQKTEILAGVEEEITLKEETLKWHEKNLRRSKKLLEQGLVAKAEYEKTESAYQQAKIEVKMVKKKLTVESTGRKPADLRMLKTQIKSLEDVIAFQEDKASNYAIYAPIGGKIGYENDQDGDRLLIEDTSAFILLIPVKAKDRYYLNKDSSIDLEVLGVDSTVTAKLLGWESNIQIMDNQQVVVAKAEVSNPIGNIVSGLPIRCTIHCGDVTPFEFLKRSITIDF